MQPGDGHWPTPGMDRVAAPSTTLSRGNIVLLCLLFPSHPIYMVGYTALGGLGRESPNPSAFLTWWGGVFLTGLVPSDDAVDSESAIGIEPGDSGLVIGYQVDEFMCAWSAESFVAHTHICPGFTGRVSSLTHLPPEPG